MDEAAPINASREDSRACSGRCDPVMAAAMIIFVLSLLCLFLAIAKPRVARVGVQPIPKPQRTATLQLRQSDVHDVQVRSSGLTSSKAPLEGSKEPVAKQTARPPQEDWEVYRAVEALRQAKSDGTPPKEIVIVPEQSCSQVRESWGMYCHHHDLPYYMSYTNRGCYYDPVENIDDVPEPSFIAYAACLYHGNYFGHKLEIFETSIPGMMADAQCETQSGISLNLEPLVFQVINCRGNNGRTRIIHMRFRRYEVHLPEVPELHVTHPGIYERTVTFATRIETARPSSRNFALSPLLRADKLVQVRFRVQQNYIYEIGDVNSAVLGSTQGHKATLLNTKRPSTEGKSIYGSHPFVMVLGESGEAFRILDSNVMDIALLLSPAAAFCVSGRIEDLYGLSCRTEVSTVQQYTGAVARHFMSLDWSLGLHVLRWDYNTEQAGDIWMLTITAGIEVEVDWLDGDYTKSLKRFTFIHTRFTGPQESVLDVYKPDMKSVLTVHPGTPSNNERKSYHPLDGQRVDVLIRTAADTDGIGHVDNRERFAFRSFTHSQAGSTASTCYAFSKTPFSSMVCRTNLSSRPQQTRILNADVLTHPLNTLLYVLWDGQQPLLTMVIWMIARLHGCRHYDVHNPYDHRQAYRKYGAPPQTMVLRGPSTSETTFDLQGRHTVHCISSDCDSLRYSVSIMPAFSVLGIPMTGPQICGFRDNAAVKLRHCWYALFALYPSARKHNQRGIVYQEPTPMGLPISSSVYNMLRMRDNFLPCIRMLFLRGDVFDDTAVRAQLLGFPKYVNTDSIFSHVLCGLHLLILPTVSQTTTVTKQYCPRGFCYGTLVGTPHHSVRGDFAIASRIDMVCPLVRGGSVISIQENPQTTATSRPQPYSLLVVKRHGEFAIAEPYWDDGEFTELYGMADYNLIRLTLAKNFLIGCCVHCRHNSTTLVKVIVICGVTEKPSDVRFNDIPVNFTYSPQGQFMKVADIHFELTMSFFMVWKC